MKDKIITKTATGFVVADTQESTDKKVKLDELKLKDPTRAKLEDVYELQLIILDKLEAK